MNEALDSIQWLIENGNSINKISLCGDSAGAHLAASVSHHLAGKDTENVHSQFLIYPMCDPNCSSESIELFKEGYLLTKNAMEWFWDKFKNSDNDKNLDTFNLVNRPIFINNDAWVCIDAFVGPGIDIGSFGIALARSVVLKDIQNHEIHIGNPAKFKKMRKKIKRQY